MSNDDVSSGQPDDEDRPFEAPRARNPWRRSGGDFFRRINGVEIGTDTVGAPGVRLAAWLAGIVLVLMILGWALESAY